MNKKAADVKTPTNPVEAFAAFRRMQKAVVGTVIKSGDPAQTLVDMDRLGAGHVWRDAAPRILEAALTEAHYGKYWKDDNEGYNLPGEAVLGMLRHGHDYNRFRGVEPSYPATHHEVLANKRLDLVVGAYEAAVWLGHVPVVAGVRDFLAHQPREVSQRFNKMRDRGQVYDWLVETEAHDLMHQATKVERMVDGDRFVQDVPALMQRAEPAPLANLVEHFGTAIAKSHPQLWTEIAHGAEQRVTRSPELAAELNGPTRFTSHGHPIVSAEAQLVRQVRQVVKSLPRPNFLLEG